MSSGPQARTRIGNDSPVELWEDLSSELWQIKDAVGARTMTLDELDAAFKRDEITTHTLVRKVGALRWRTLAEVANIEPSAPMLESESLMPVTSEIDVTAPKIPRPPAMPRIGVATVAAGNSGDYEALHSEDLLPEVNDTLKVTRFAGIGDTFDDDEITTRYTQTQLQAAQTVAPRSSMARKIFGFTAVAVVGLGVFGGTSFVLSREFGQSHVAAASALTAEAPVTSPAAELPPAREPAPAPAALNIASVEGSVLVLNPSPGSAPDSQLAPAASASASAAVVVGKRPPMVRVAPAKKSFAAPSAPAGHAGGHFAVKAEPRKGFGAKAGAQSSVKAKSH